jgi:hypothetical protein
LIRRPLADNAARHLFRARHVIDAKAGAVVVLEIEFADVPL